MANAKVFLAGERDGEWIPMKETGYDQEVILQVALAEYPDLIPGDQIDPERPWRWLLVRREVPVPAELIGGSVGSLDHLFLDQDGIPTLVECKRAEDTRNRREVVAQMLDYAANGTEYWPIDKLRQFAAETARERGFSLDDSLGELIDAVDDEAFDAYWDLVEGNLRDGRIRLIFVADGVPKSLRRLVEFLNDKMNDVEVLAVEVKQYLGHGQKAMVPRVIGLTEAAREKKGRSPKRKWDETSFFADLRGRVSEDEVRAARHLLDWIRTNVTYVWWGKGLRRGSFVPILMHNDRKHQLFAIWSNSSIEFYFQWFQKKIPFDSEEKRMELLLRLNTIPGIALPEDAIGRRPWVSLSVFTDQTNLKELKTIFEWVIDENFSCVISYTFCPLTPGEV